MKIKFSISVLPLIFMLGTLSFTLLACVTSFASPAIKIPLQFGKNGTPIVIALLDGIPVRLGVDTGAHNCLSSDAYKTLTSFHIDIHKTDKNPVNYTAENASVGVWQLHSTSFDILRYHAFDNVLAPDHLDGLLGIDTLNKYILDWDFGRQTLTIMTPDDLTRMIADKKFHVVHMHESTDKDASGLFKVPVTVEGRHKENISLTLLLDTGSAGVLLPPAIFMHHTAIIGGPERLFTQTVAGMMYVIIYRVAALAVGEAYVKSPLVQKSNFGIASQGLLGIDFLRRFHVIMDFSSKALYLQPDPVFKETNEFVGIGIDVDENNTSLVVSTVMKCSPSSETDLKKDDVILAIDGYPTKDMSRDEALRYWDKPIGTVVRLRYRRKGENKIRETRMLVRSLR